MWKRHLYAAFAAILISGVSAFGDSITLKSSVRMTPGCKSIKLADIAELEGSEAMALGDLTIAELPESHSAIDISVQQVRSALDGAGVRWGTMTLSGRVVTVRPVRISSEPPLAMAAVSLQDEAPKQKTTAERITFAVEDVIQQQNVCGAVARLLAAGNKVAPAQLRFTCDEKTAALLRSFVHTAQFEVQPLGSVNSDRVDMNVRTWANGRVQGTNTITIYPEIQTLASVAGRPISKGDVIGDRDVAEQLLWLSPSQATQCAPTRDVVGRIAGINIKATELVRLRDVRRESLIKRGDAVIVRCLVGGTVITLQAEARNDGAEGDLIELRKLGERDVFHATVTGKAEATMNLNRQHAQQRDGSTEA